MQSAPVTGPVTEEQNLRQNPFPGLRPYEQRDADWFFGRDQEINDLLRKFRQAHFLAVVGPSGCGKSSLIKAGVLRSLNDGFLGAHWKIAEFRPGGGPIRELSKALAQTLGASDTDAMLRRGSMGIIDLVGKTRLPEDTRLLIFVDQFEELFRYAKDEGQPGREETKAFLKLLLTAVVFDELPIYLIMTMRMEWLAECASYVGFAEAINEGIYVVPQMTRRQFRQAIVAPIEQAGGAINAGLVDRLLNDLDGQTDQLPVLQHVLMRMWRVNVTGKVLDLEQYVDSGTFDECLSRHAERVYSARINDQERVLAEKLFRAITEVTPENRRVRRPRAVGEICRMLGVTTEQLRPVVEGFAKSGRNFLFTSPQPPLTEHTVIDISHEALMRQWVRLRNWVNEEAELRQTARRLEETASEWAVRKSISYLYSGYRLQQASKVQALLSPVGKDFLAASKQSRRIKGVVIWLALFVLVSSGSKWWNSWWDSHQKGVSVEKVVAVDDALKASMAETQQTLSAAKSVLDCVESEDCSDAKLKYLRSTVSKGVDTNRPRVFIHIESEEQRPCAKRAQDALSEYLVLGIHLVGSIPKVSEVRFFHEGQDAELATKIAQNLTNLSGAPVQPTAIKGYENVPEKQFEIWLAPGFVCK